MIVEKAVVQLRLAEELPQWQLNSDGSGICRIYNTTSWKSALMLVNAIGFLAEARWHHPEILLRYSSVSVDLTTHSEGGITEKDLALAVQIEKLVFDSPECDALQAPPATHALLKAN